MVLQEAHFMALDEAADDVGLSGKQEGTEGLPEQQGLLASDEAHERARRGVEKTPCLPPTQHTYSDSAAAPADAAQPAAAAAANTSSGGLGQQRKRKREGAPDGQAAEDATDALRERLAAAAGRFAVLPQKPQLWLEADLAARLGPFEMVGRTVRILWPDDDAWYLASIAGYNESTGEHLVRLDGTVDAAGRWPRELEHSRWCCISAGWPGWHAVLLLASSRACSRRS